MLFARKLSLGGANGTASIIDRAATHGTGRMKQKNRARAVEVLHLKAGEEPGRLTQKAAKTPHYATNASTLSGNQSPIPGNDK
ncbi:hypothetical protein ON010_g4719 [Phytophthora cinnamomi]|nr:hypothetical protein ON010_g4719 [Phytophthora cinnamomi]